MRPAVRTWPSRERGRHHGGPGSVPRGEPARHRAPHRRRRERLRQTEQGGRTGVAHRASHRCQGQSQAGGRHPVPPGGAGSTPAPAVGVDATSEPVQRSGAQGVVDLARGPPAASSSSRRADGERELPHRAEPRRRRGRRRDVRRDLWTARRLWTGSASARPTHTSAAAACGLGEHSAWRDEQRRSGRVEGGGGLGHGRGGPGLHRRATGLAEGGGAPGLGEQAPTPARRGRRRRRRRSAGR